MTRLPLLTAALATSIVLVGASGAAAATPLTISPADGAPVNAKTQISILGVAAGAIRSVTVSGDKSGAHPGTLRSYKAVTGASFLPKTPLTVGESGHFTVRLKNGTKVTRSFTVATLGRQQPFLTFKVFKLDQLENFVTRPDLIAPKVTVNKRTSAASKQNVLLTPLPSPVVHPGSANTVTLDPVGPGGPMIIDSQGKLVWFRKLTLPDVAANLRVQTYRGKKVLTWWQGKVTVSAFGQGQGIIADSHYRTVAAVSAGNGYDMDIHEFTLTKDGLALFTVYSPVMMHLPGTPDGKLSPVMDSILQEVDPRTGLVVWEWHALGHIPLSESYATSANSISYDAYHFNSAQSLGNGDVLVSARDTAAIYRVDRATGKRVWTLGGKKSSFKVAKNAKFWLQHDAHLLPHNRVSMFDDEAGPPMKLASARPLILSLDLQKRTAKLYRQYHRPVDTSVQSEGSIQLLPGGNVFGQWGAEGFMSEWTPKGKLVFDAGLPKGDGSYRAYRSGWQGSPTAKPDVVARRVDASHVAVYASWNGAMDVARWQVLAGSSTAPVVTAKRTGFETKIAVSSSATSFAVRAVDAHGKVLRTSNAVPVS
jgi:hypothetical protein